MQNIKALVLFFIFYFLFFIFSHAQDSSHLQVSLLTCGPGQSDDELYTTFGHTGIRIVDSSSVSDIVYNYGTFDEFEENFYLKFIKGRLRYYVSVEDFKDFKEAYQQSNRGITEQVLNLTAAEKTNVQHFLNNNLKTENKYYRYDFCFDNCTTRLRDIIKKNHDSSFTKTAVMPIGTTFRQAIYFCLDRNNQQWSKLGIDILLGKPCDALMTTEQMEFLPENLLKGLDASKKPFVKSEAELYPISKSKNNFSITTPNIIFWFLLIFIIALQFIKNQWVQYFLNGFDGLLFFIVGLLGILLIFMWFDTDHLMTKNNFNLLWAWPTHFVISFFINSKKQWVKYYFLITAIMLSISLLCWFILPQHLNTSLIPVVLLLIYLSISKYLKSN